MFQADPRGILTLIAVALCWALALLLNISESDAAAIEEELQAGLAG